MLPRPCGIPTGPAAPTGPGPDGPRRRTVHRRRGGPERAAPRRTSKARETKPRRAARPPRRVRVTPSATKAAGRAPAVAAEAGASLLDNRATQRHVRQQPARSERDGGCCPMPQGPAGRESAGIAHHFRTGRPVCRRAQRPQVRGAGGLRPGRSRDPACWGAAWSARGAAAGLPGFFGRGAEAREPGAHPPRNTQSLIRCMAAVAESSPWCGKSRLVSDGRRTPNGSPRRRIVLNPGQPPLAPPVARPACCGLAPYGGSGRVENIPAP